MRKRKTPNMRGGLNCGVSEIAFKHESTRAPKPGQASIETYSGTSGWSGDILLKVRMVGLCGSDLNSFRGLNPLVSFPRIPGHEVSATIMEGDGDLPAGTDVALSPYTAAVSVPLAGGGVRMPASSTRPWACSGTAHSLNSSPCPERSCYPARLSRKELCLVEPLTVGFHAVARGRVAAADTVAIFGCGGVGLGAVAGSSVRGARTICVDVEDEKLRLALRGRRRPCDQQRQGTVAQSPARADRRTRSGCRDRSHRITRDIPRGSRRSRIHGQGGVHRICQRTCEL